MIANPGVARRQGGLTLLEVIIAVFIVSVAAAIFVVTSRTSVTGQLRSKVYGDAATATKEVLESLQLIPIDSVSNLSNALMPHSQGPTVEVRATARGVLPADVSNFAALDTASLRHVTLATRFKQKSGAYTVRLFTTIVYKP